MDKLRIEVWTRADGMIEVEGAGTMRRFDTNDEADAYVAGLRAGYDLARIPDLGIEDRRAVRSYLEKNR